MAKKAKFNSFDRIGGTIGGFWVEGTYLPENGGRIVTPGGAVYGVPSDAKKL